MLCYHWLMADDLQRYLDSLQRDDCYLVDTVLKDGGLERTERVYFAGVNGGRLGPFVRKIYRASDGVGAAWWRVMEAQRAGARFVHLPRIVDCYEMGEESAVVMEFVRGKTLDEVVRARGASVLVAKDLFGGACDAVTELHTSFDPPLIHRDIKPSNLMLSGGKVILIDLGIARAFNDEAATDTVKFGTRGFAPPEQFGFGQTDVRSDVYALGMLLFYLMTGKVPEPSSVEKVMVERRIPRELRAVVLKAAAFDPVARYASAHELKCAALASFAAACPSSPAGAAAKAGPAAGSAPLARTASANHLAAAGGLSFGSATGAAASARIGGAVDASPSGSSDAIVLPALGEDPAAAARRTLSRPGTRFESFLKASIPLGRAWDVLIAASSALFLLVVILSCAFPNEEMSRIPLLPRAWEYLAMWLLLVCPSIALCDPRPLKRYLPRFAALGFAKRLALMFLAAGISIVVIGVTNSVFVPR